MKGKGVRAVLNLGGKWNYRKDPDRKGEEQKLYDPGSPRKDWGEMEIPVNWYNTEVGDYHGVIWFAKEFDLPKEARAREHFLRFNAVDYIGEVWLNGEYLGRHEGFFAPFEFRVTDFVKSGKNTVIIKVDSPFDETEYRLAPEPPGFERPLSEPYKLRKPVALTTIKGAMIDFWHRPGWHTQFSQDGNTGGIWQSVELLSTGTLIIENVKIYPKLVKRDDEYDGTALVAVDVDVYSAEDHTVKAEVSMEARGKNFDISEEIKKSKEFVLKPGSNRIKLVHTVEKPRLWWCWDQGDPNLYQMKLSVKTNEIQDEVEETFGIRELVLDEKGHWYLNGRRVFARGMRYLSSIWLGEATEEIFQDDCNRMKSLNINAVRIGSHVEQPRFYELCDEMGFMVWQVFPMHWGNYSDSDELIERTSPMMREMVSLLYNYASVVIWSVFKEPLVYPFEPKPNLYGRLCEIMYEEARTIDPIRWVHKGDYGEGVQNVTTGGWGMQWWDYKERVELGSPQKVEFGTTSIAPLETVKQILKPEEMWPPDWDRWYYLNLDPNWLKYQGIDWESMNSIEELVEANQSWEARQVKETGEYLRQRKYQPTASMFLYFWIDPWPCLGGAGLLDYYRRKYKSYDIYGLIFNPVLVSIEWVKEKHYVGFEKEYGPGENFAAKIWVTNDLYETYEKASVTWCIKDPAGKMLTDGAVGTSVGEDSSQVVKELLWPIPRDAQGKYRMEVSLEDKAGKPLSDNWFEFQVHGSRGFKK